MQKRRVVILGSTGSIGTSALKVVRDIPDRMEIVGLAAGTSVEALARQEVNLVREQVAMPALGRPLRGRAPAHRAPHPLSFCRRPRRCPAAPA